MENPDADSPGPNPLEAPELIIDGDTEAVDDTSDSEPPPGYEARGGPPPLPPQLPSTPPPRTSAPPPEPSVELPPAGPNKNFMLLGGAVLLVLVGVAVFAGLKVGNSLRGARAVEAMPSASTAAPTAAPSAEAVAPAPSAPIIAIPTVEFAN